jgi:predicted DNA-binding protein (UPF0251 family)
LYFSSDLFTYEVYRRFAGLLIPRFPAVRPGSRLDYDQLCQAAHRLLSDSDLTQQAMADRLGVSRISVARAVTEAGPKFQRLQMRIVEALSGVQVERRERVEFIIRRPEEASDGA